MHDETAGLRVIHFQQALLPDGWKENVRITISGGLIVGIDVSAKPQRGDDCHALGIPGMPNLHSHAFQRGMAGLTEVRGSGADSFWTWRDAMYWFVERINPEHLRAIAALAYVEMLEAGFTRVGEFHYLHHDINGNAYSDPAELSHAIIAAAADSGIGLTHLPVFYAHGGFGAINAGDAQRRFITNPDSFARLLDGVRSAAATLPDAIVGVAPHSLRAVTADELRELEQLGRAGPVHIHIAEQLKEVEDCLAWSGRRPVDWLMDHADVDERWCLVHATHSDEGEALAVAQSGAVVGLCPITEANLGDGVFTAAAFFKAGGRFGIGSDSNILIDMSEELRWLEYGQRLDARERNLLAPGCGASTGQGLFQAALHGGAQALGVVAGLAIGHAADMVGLDVAHPSFAGRSAMSIMDSFLFAAGRQAITAVWRRGNLTVINGRHVARERIVARYRKAMEALVA